MILDALLGTRAEANNQVTTDGAFGWQSFGGGLAGTAGLPTAAGVTVDEDKSLTFSAVWCGVTTLAAMIGALPFQVFRRLDVETRKVWHDHPVYSIIHDRPNKFMTAVTFWECLEGNRVLFGNAYAKIVHNRGRIESLWPIYPRRVRVVQVDGERVYVIHGDDGQVAETLMSGEILHVPAFTQEGLEGLGAVHVNRESIGQALAAEQASASFLDQGIIPTGLLKMKGMLDDEQHKLAEEELQKLHRGPSRKFRALILDESADWKQIGVDPDKVQLLESRKYNVNNVSRILRIPPHMLGDTESMKWRNVEQMARLLEKFTLRDTVERYEQEVTYKLFRPGEPAFAEMNLDGLLRADSETRHKTHRSGFEVGLYTCNDLRAMENRAGYGPIGDVPFVSKALVPLAEAVKAQSDTINANEMAQVRSESTAAARDTFITFAARAFEKERHEVAKAQTKWNANNPRYKAWLTRFYNEHRARIIDAALPGLVGILRCQDLATGPAKAWVSDWFSSYSSDRLAEPFEAAGLEPVNIAIGMFEEFSKCFGCEVGK